MPEIRWCLWLALLYYLVTTPVQTIADLAVMLGSVTAMVLVEFVCLGESYGGPGRS